MGRRRLPPRWRAICPRRMSQSLPIPVVCALYQDSRGAFWIGQQRFKPEVLQFQKGIPRWLTLPSPTPLADVRAIVEDSEYNIWVGTFDDGLYRIRDNQITR